MNESYPPNVNSNSEIQNGVISLILPDTTFIFIDSVLNNTTQGNLPLSSFYYINNFTLTKGTDLKIEATLPDGTLLTSETKSPSYFNLTLLEEGGGPRTIPLENSVDTYYYRWRIFGNYEEYIFGPSFYIKYFLTGNEEEVHYKKVIGKQNYTNEFKILKLYIDETMLEISEGINNKSLINIIGACFEVKVFDNALGVYVNSIQTFEDEFSVRISEPNISNINGGLGIFGSYISETFDISIAGEYIRSFGYTAVQELK